MMDAARLKRARRRMRAYLIGGGLIGGFVFLCLAGAVIALIGVDTTSYFATLVFAAAVLSGGTYAIFMFTWLIFRGVRRLFRGEPLLSREGPL
jgi:hypothetical protein